MSQTVQGLFDGVAAAGVLGAKALDAIDVEDLGEQIQAGLGLTPDDVQASETTLINILIDDSGSIRFGTNAELVRQGHNQMLDALTGTKQKDGILAHCRYLNGTVLYSYIRVADAVRMDASNYNPNGGTPLYDQAILMLSTAAAKCQQFADSGIPARGVTVVVTDGADTGSSRTAADVATVARDLLKSEQHIIIGMGIDDGQTDFKQVFSEMGVPKEWILTPGNTQSEIRRAFAMVSQSAVRASQGGAAFSKTAMGGFGK